MLSHCKVKINDNYRSNSKIRKNKSHLKKKNSDNAPQIKLAFG